MVLLVVDRAQNESHHLLYCGLQLGMPLGPDCSPTHPLWLVSVESLCFEVIEWY